MSARPSEEEESRAPHQLYGYRDGGTACSAADWAADAKATIAAAHRAGKLPILVGGTGLYIRTLLDGIAPIPPIDLQVRSEVRALPVETAYALLEAEDQVAALRLNPNDSSRIARALEVVRSTGRPLDFWQTQKEGGIGDAVDLRPLLLLPERDWLYPRCDSRFESMLGDDGRAEGMRLLARSLDPALPVMRAIGVPQVLGLLRGEMSWNEALVAGQTATRQYAKRQFTWFRNQPPENWPRFTGRPDGSGANEALALLGLQV